MTIEDLEQSLNAAIAARDLALAACWAVWADIGGLAADEQISICVTHFSLSSSYVNGGTRGLPRWQREKIVREREAVQERARARVDAALTARGLLCLHPEWVKAGETFKALDAAVSAASAKWRAVTVKPKTEQEKKDEMARAISDFRWNGKDADGDWADD